MATEGQQPQVTVQISNSGPGLPLRIVWFVLVGWWLGQFALLSAWALNVLISTLPLGLYILNRLPQVFTLRPANKDWQVSSSGGVTVVQEVGVRQTSFLLRALYFVLIGWWLSLIWMEIAWLAGITLVLLPLSFWMFGRSAAMTTLRKT